MGTDVGCSLWAWEELTSALVGVGGKGTVVGAGEVPVGWGAVGDGVLVGGWGVGDGSMVV